MRVVLRFSFIDMKKRDNDLKFAAVIFSENIVLVMK